MFGVVLALTYNTDICLDEHIQETVKVLVALIQLIPFEELEYQLEHHWLELLFLADVLKKILRIMGSYLNGNI